MNDYIYLGQEKKKIRKMDLLEMLNPIPDDIVYVGGSLIEGTVNPASRRIGNAYSDLDLFIIRNHEEYKSTSGVYINEIKRTFFTELNGISCDVEVFDVNRVNAVIRAINRVEIESNKRIYNSFRLPMGWSIQDTNEFLTRLTYSIPIQNAEKYEEIRKNICLSKFLEFKKFDILQTIDNEIEDIRGNMMQGELETALLISRSVSYEWIDFILACEGIFNDRQKWSWIKIQNLAIDKPKYKNAYDTIRRIQFEDISNSSVDDIKYFLEVMEETIQEDLIEVTL